MRYFALIISFLASCVLMPGTICRASEGGSFSDFFVRANESYSQGKYAEAASYYEKVVNSGCRSGNVYYNLGNSYLKNGELAKAILNYERAKILIPHDADLHNNRRYARSLMKQEDPPERRSVGLKILDKISEKATISVMLVLVCILYFGLMFYLVTDKVLKRSLFMANFIIILAISGLVSLIIPLKYRIWDLETSAIVSVSIVDAKFEPDASGLAHFPLYEGMKVNILRTQGSWRRIMRPDGTIGWINASDITPVTPM